jgi:hypothetical protein
MDDIKVFPNAGEALCYMVECTMATAEHMKSLKRASKHEIQRLESIIATGLHNCRRFNLADAAHSARCHRVEEALRTTTS